MQWTRIYNKQQKQNTLDSRIDWHTAYCSIMVLMLIESDLVAVLGPGTSQQLKPKHPEALAPSPDVAAVLQYTPLCCSDMLVAFCAALAALIGNTHSDCSHWSLLLKYYCANSGRQLCPRQLCPQHAPVSGTVFPMQGQAKSSIHRLAHQQTERFKPRSEPDTKAD
jgi:hypothetical protein